VKRFFKFITQTWLLTLLAVILLSLIVWFIGPLIAIAEYKPLTSELVRLGIIFFLLIAWGLNNLRKQKKSKDNSKKIAEEITTVAQPNQKKPQSPDEKILADTFNKAVKTLQTSRFGKKNKLYTLPWYVIIGMPGSGKTTALKNSGLQFPLHSQFGNEPIQGSGGTRYCDWWFTNEAIIIDTAGRYTAQEDAKKTEAKSWNSFLNILKKGRPKRPLNGILVTINIQDILRKTNTQKSLHATAIKQRIQELNHQLTMELPIYVIFTKTDTIAGFNSFFSDMEQEERDQVWGLPYLLDHEKNQNQRNLIHQFPHQMHALRPLLFEFLNNIFTPNQFETPLILRGIYLISGTQSNMGSQWVSGSLPTEKLNDPIDHIKTEAKTFFVKDLMQKVIFKEANLAKINTKSRRRFTWTFGALATFVILGFSGLLLAWQNSLSLNNDYIESVRTDINQYLESTDGGLIDARNWLSLATGLNHLKELPKGFIEGSKNYPLQQGLGFYQGHKIGGEASNTYKKALHAFLMKDINQLLERQIASAGDDEQLYEALKFYLMLYNPDKMELDTFRVWTEILLQRELPGNGNNITRETILSHLDTALEQSVAPAPINQPLVDKAREGFHSAYNIQNKKLAERLANEQWIYGDSLPEDLSEEKIQSITEKVDEYYFAEYISLWEDLLRDLRIQSFSSINQGQAVLRLLASSEQPLIKTIEAIRKNTALSEAPSISNEKKEALGKLAEDFADSEKNRLERLLPITALGGDLSLPGYPVTDYFGNFNQYAQYEDGLPLSQLQQSINELNIHFSDLANAGNLKEAAFSASLEAKTGSDPINNLNRAVNEAQGNVKQWFDGISAKANIVTTAAAKGHVNNTWQTQGESPQASFRLKPLSLDKLTSGVLLDMGGQSIIYNHGPLKSEKMTWPGDSTKNTKLAFSLISDGTPVSSQTEGEWSWFRLLDRYGELKPTNDSLELLFELKGITMEYQLTPESSFNPFTRNVIAGFTLPKQL